MSVVELKEMDFILNEAIEEEDDFKTVFFDESEGEYSEEEEDKMFVCNSFSDEDGEQEASFYRSLNNKEERVKFRNQTTNPEEVVDESEDEYFGEDDSLKFLILKLEKMLNLIRLAQFQISRNYLKIASCVFPMI